MDLVALKPRPRLLTLDGLLTHGYVADKETLDYIKDMITEARIEEHRRLEEFISTPFRRVVAYRNSPQMAFDDGAGNVKHYIRKWSQTRKDEINDKS